MNKPATEVMFEMLNRNLEAWEGEEDSVKAEHATLIEDTRRMVNAYLIPMRGSQIPNPMLIPGLCKTDPSSNSDSSSVPPHLPWLVD